MKNEPKLVDQFVDEILKRGTYHELDRRYLINRIFALVGEQSLTSKQTAVDLL